MATRSYELLPRELLEALGTLLVSFSELEESLHFAIAFTFAPAEQRAYCLTAGLPFRTLVEKFGALYHDLPRRKVTSEDVTSFCAVLNTLNEQRNQLVHAIWLSGEGDAVHRTSRRATPKQGLHERSEPVNAAEVLALARKCDDTESTLFTYVLAAGEPPTRASFASS